MEEEKIEISIPNTKKTIGRTIEFLKQKKVITTLVVIFLIAMLFFSSWIRTTNIPNLKDVTTGNYTLGPDLDPFLYLRVAHEIVDFGHMLNPDYMRYHGITPYYNIIPYSIAYLYQILSVFTSTSLEYAAIILPVIFFGASILVFFFLVKKVFNKKSILQKNLIAVFSTALYVVTPLMLHRTVAGVPELESGGLFFFWLSFLLFLYAWEKKDENSKSSLFKRYLLALLSGIATSFMIFTWGGFKFIFMALSIAVLIEFILGKVKKQETIIYGLWFLPSILFLMLKSGIGILFEITSAVPSVFVFGVLLVGLFMKKSWEEKIKGTLKKEWISKEIISILLVLIAGALILLIIRPTELIGLLSTLKESLLYPFGRQRVSLTVAENAKPYVTDWMGQFGKGFFWLFFFGTILLFYNAVEHLYKKEKIILNLSFIIFIFGFIFSRYSSSGAFNGQNFISQVVYFGSLFLFVFALGYIYIKRYKNHDLEGLSKIDFSYIFLLSLIILMIVASRGAIRLFVISSPVFIIAAGFLPVALLNYWIKSKDDFLKIFLIIFLIISLIYLTLTFINYEKITAESAKATIPGAYDTQWQQAMFWVRSNTPVNSMFVHWWDYGYWIQTLGKRPTVTDGGHEVTYWDHLTGRYVLTTPDSNAALSYMKTNNVSYLLIDSSDLGKYPAYSSIGSDSSGEDRFSQIPIMIFNPSQTVETSDKETRIYEGPAPVDKDIIYSNGSNEIFLPSNKAFVIGMIIELSKKNNYPFSLGQPIVVFVYNNQQIRIPLRYAYYKGEILDFKSGIEGIARITQKVELNNNGGADIDNFGSVIYLSPKVSKSLFAQLYLMDDVFKNYNTLTLAHSQSDLLVSNLKASGFNSDEIIYFQGFRGPIKIWKVEYPENILVKNEFLKTSGQYGEMDNLTFTK
jgi:asparagine N-glycosylation enzyme membrane subunit Stt3